MWNFCGPQLTTCTVLLAVAWSRMQGAHRALLGGSVPRGKGAERASVSHGKDCYSSRSQSLLRGLVRVLFFNGFSVNVCLRKNSSAFPPEKIHHLTREKVVSVLLPEATISPLAFCFWKGRTHKNVLLPRNKIAAFLLKGELSTSRVSQWACSRPGLWAAWRIAALCCCKEK